MSFTSAQFLLFFPLVTVLYFAIPHKWRWLHLLTASCVFYMAFVPVYLLILLGTVVVDYWAGIAIAGASGRRRQLFLLVSIAANVGVLSLFKYYNFFVDNVMGLASLAGVHLSLPLLRMILPIGLSFHTFQAMSYTIEVYRGDQEPERHFGIYALYVMFYPQLVAGPIERPQNMLHQFRERHGFVTEDVVTGCQRMMWGFFKKTVVADRLADSIDTVFRAPHDFTAFQMLLATVFFAVQVYADFSGYSDIAVGAAQVIGFRLMRNFDRPYFATSPSDFWRRWHMSLYSWFNDYVYLPLAIGARDFGKFGVIAAVLVTFAVSGLWHGAAWTFVAWGTLHGVGIAVDVLTKRLHMREALPPPVRSAFGWAFTMAVVLVGYAFFRANSIGDAVFMVRHLAIGVTEAPRVMANAAETSRLLGGMGLFRDEFIVALVGTVLMFGGEALHARIRIPSLLAQAPMVLRWSFYYALVASVLFFGQYNSVQPFIYFQF